MYEVSIFYEERLVEDKPDKKVGLGRVREESKKAATLTASRLPNGNWQTHLEHLNIPIW